MTTNQDEPIASWPCQRCGRTVEHWNPGEDESCVCGAEYNAFGQRLRDDWRGNPSNYDEDISDLDGFEMQHAGDS